MGARREERRTVSKIRSLFGRDFAFLSNFFPNYRGKLDDEDPRADGRWEEENRVEVEGERWASHATGFSRSFRLSGQGGFGVGKKGQTYRAFKDVDIITETRLETFKNSVKITLSPTGLYTRVKEDVQINIIFSEKWETYVTNLYETRAGGSEDWEGDIHQEQLLEEDNITLEEVHEALAKLINRKTPGPDLLPKRLNNIEKSRRNKTKS
ncbi:hypothetical protein Trydic_g20343 [Trypoxylus dichotomus]